MYLRKDGSPYYIGKGQRDRAYTTHQKNNISTPKDRNRIKLFYCPDEPAAFAYEMYLIDFWGRKDLGTGILHNRTDGGGYLLYNWTGRKRSRENLEKARIASTGRKFSEESKKKMSESAKRRGPNRVGPCSEEAKRKMSEAKKGQTSTMKGKKHSEEAKKRMSESHKGFAHSEENKENMRKAQKLRRATETEETKEKASLSRRGEKNHFFGRKHSEESLKKMSEAQKRTHANNKNRERDANSIGGK
jgi:hypothetical protein